MILPSRGASAAAALTVVVGLLGACSGPASGPVDSPSAVPSPDVVDAYLVSEQGPPPGPPKPFRGDAVQQVRVVDGYLSMYFELKNVGEEPVTFLNTLYDYEPDQLYTPAVRLEWQEGGNAVYTRSGRFFPSPAILEPGETGVFLMGGQPVRGSGTYGDLITHIKYCPTRGMDDLPSQPIEVSDLAWTSADGVTTVSGTLTQRDGAARPSRPTVGVAFFDGSGTFIGAVVQSAVGDALAVDDRVAFEVSGRGVLADRIATAHAWAWAG